MKRAVINSLLGNAVCSVCWCREERACVDGCFWAIKPTPSRRGTCSNCVGGDGKTPMRLAERFPKDHQVFWVRRDTLMGPLGDEGVVVAATATRVNIRVGDRTHWVTPGRILDESLPPEPASIKQSSRNVRARRAHAA